MIFCRIRRAFLINIAESGLILGNLLSLWINVRSHDRHGFTGSLYLKKRDCPEDGVFRQKGSLFLCSLWIPGTSFTSQVRVVQRLTFLPSRQTMRDRHPVLQLQGGCWLPAGFIGQSSPVRFRPLQFNKCDTCSNHSIGEGFNA